MLDAVFKYQFLQNALAIGLLSALICGIMGVIITEKKLLMLSGGIAHTAYGGVGLGYLIGIQPIIGALIFSTASAVVIGKINRTKRVQSDVVIALLWSAGMALGITFTGLMPGYPPDMNSYLFGNILSVSHSDILVLAVLSFITLSVYIIFQNDWKAYLFDTAFAEISGINTAVLEYTLLILVALCVVALIKAVGIILCLALLSAPAASAALFSKTLKGRIILSVILTLIFNLTGLTLSYYFGIASGATIVLVAILTYFILLFVTKGKCK
ncbi:MAG: metal ABC transporter permease [Clostridia bacterium]|nr:metal ABC transporter permease [Clostridia bacterium]